MLYNIYVKHFKTEESKMTLCLEIDKNRKSETLDLVDDEGFITIRGFMRTRLRLEKTELIVYAIIYGFHSSGHTFKGSVRFLCEWSGNGRTAVRSALASLVKKGYIIKYTEIVNNIEYVEYSVNEKVLGKI